MGRASERNKSANADVALGHPRTRKQSARKCMNRYEGMVDGGTSEVGEERDSGTVGIHFPGWRTPPIHFWA